MGPVEAAPEYRVIVDANNLTVEIENELSEYREGRPVETENELSEQAETALPGVPHSLSCPTPPGSCLLGPTVPSTPSAPGQPLLRDLEVLSLQAEQLPGV